MKTNGSQKLVCFSKKLNDFEKELEKIISILNRKQNKK